MLAVTTMGGRANRPLALTESCAVLVVSFRPASWPKRIAVTDCPATTAVNTITELERILPPSENGGCGETGGSMGTCVAFGTHETRRNGTGILRKGRA